jgi:hypothetical protein
MLVSVLRDHETIGRPVSRTRLLIPWPPSPRLVGRRYRVEVPPILREPSGQLDVSFLFE